MRVAFAVFVKLCLQIRVTASRERAAPLVQKPRGPVRHPGPQGHDIATRLPLPAAQPPSQRSVGSRLEQRRAGLVTLKGGTQLRHVQGSLPGGRKGLAAHLP